ncbi:NUDIX hydrolase [Streptomyces sp. 135]|uniref:NUDIX hydrolase n=1 Tax=Streptomyces sp. 135 TaxID=2838850 RepID=UPI001CC09DF0|nr:NUDIX hydrolase [Streptomyces sp. 135]
MTYGDGVGDEERGGDTVLAAGCVLWRPAATATATATATAEDSIELALVYRPKWADWSHPKGKLKHGESARDAAVREVLEETGMTCAPSTELTTAHYRDAYGRPKEVRYWAAEAVSGTFTPNSEVTELRWLSPGEAGRRLTQPGDVDLVTELLAVRARGLPGNPGRPRHTDSMGT